MLTTTTLIILLTGLLGALTLVLEGLNKLSDWIELKLREGGE